ncbi:methyl-accepting chemotaxis protein [Chitinimonas sp.]|uniref:methyl-accepting chemotaxis protein n=1 Tax=Chitinimonas sp. TaxID=1934313 RepID=UPI0035B199A7
MNTHLKPLLIGFASFIVVLIAALSLASYILLGRANDILDGQLNRAILVSDAMAAANFHIAQIQQFVTDSAATGEKDGMEDAGKELAQANAALAQISQLEPRYAAAASALQGQAQTLLSTGAKMVEQYAQGREAGNQIMKSPGGFDAQTDAMHDHLEQLSKQVAQARSAAQAGLDHELEQNLRVVLGMGSLIALASIAGSVLLYRRVFRILGGEPAIAARLSEHLAEGNLGHAIHIADHARASLLGRLAAMRQRWLTIAGQLHQHAGSVSHATAQVLDSADELARASERQSSATSAIAANLEQMSANIHEISDQATQANQQVESTGKAAASSAALIAQVAQEIQQVASSVGDSARQVGLLDARAKDIEQIVTVIREIADQTNLLALNAAIEAARAGETGRGFAVVADEVRKLAERTTSSTASIAGVIGQVHAATREIVTTIDQSVARVDASVALTAQAAGAMTEIRDIAALASSQVHAINDALGEQRANTEDIVKRVEQIASLADENASLATALSQASHQLSDVADGVRTEVAFFKLAHA